RADHPDKAAPLLERGAHHLLVEGMAARYRNQAAVAVELERIDCDGERFDDYPVCARKAIAIGERGAIVDHRDVEAQHRAETGQRLPDMAGARNYHSQGA